MDKKTMDRIISETDSLLSKFDPELVRVLAQNQYNAQFTELGNMVVSLSVAAFTGDDRRAEMHKANIKAALSALDALCERFGIEAKHEAMKNIVDTKEQKDEG